MKQFDLFINIDPDSNQAYPFFVDIQNDLLDALNSRVVIPVTKSLPTKALPKNLCPEVEIAGEPHYLLTYQLTTVSKSFLKHHSGSLSSERVSIINALDFLVSGF